MQTVLTPLDIAIFFGSLLVIMGFGLWAGRKEETSEDYYLAGKSTRWWGVAGSIFGSNVSANHIVGMMAVGFSVGFAQSHFEVGAIAGLLLLCYGFLPVYRKLNVYTLSEYLGLRYSDASRVLYAMIMIIIMVVVQMVPGYYIGSRSLNILLFDYGDTATATAMVGDDGSLESITVDNGGAGYASVPEVEIDAPREADGVPAATATAEIDADGNLVAINIDSAGSGYLPGEGNAPMVRIVGGASFDPAYSPGDVNPWWYLVGIIGMAIVTGSYTILGGLKAVIFTDVVQSVLMIFAALVVAILMFSQPEVGGWAGMLNLDAAAETHRMNLYLPSDHPVLPWTGVLTGVMILHLFYWGTNQFIVQRALAARTDSEARLGIIVAGFFKLLIPFMSIGTGIAAFYYFQKTGQDVRQDAAFTEIMRTLVAPVGFGLVGIIAAGLIGAILSSLDSMMNSAATIMTFDIYKKYINPEASEKQLIFYGRMWITVFITAAAVFAWWTMDPNSEKSFFLQIAEYQIYLICGVVVAFVFGMFWKRATAAGGAAAIVAGVLSSFAIKFTYNNYLAAEYPELVTYLGPRINFAHVGAIGAVVAAIVHFVVSLATAPNEQKSRYVWTDLGGHSPKQLARTAGTIGVSLAVYIVLAVLMVQAVLPASICAVIASAWTFAMFLGRIFLWRSDDDQPGNVLLNDRLWAGLLASLAIFIMFFFYQPLG